MSTARSDDGLRPLGMIAMKGGAGQKEKGYFINTSCTRRVGGILIGLSLLLVILGLTSSAKIAQQRTVVGLKEGMLHQRQIRDAGGLQQHDAKLVKTLTMMQVRCYAARRGVAGGSLAAHPDLPRSVLHLHCSRPLLRSPVECAHDCGCVAR